MSLKAPSPIKLPKLTDDEQAHNIIIIIIIITIVRAARTDFPNSLSVCLSVSLATHLNHSSLPAGFPGYILCPYRAGVDMF